MKKIRFTLQGGGWFDTSRSCRAVERCHWNPKLRVSVIGFRLIRKPYKGELK